MEHKVRSPDALNRECERYDDVANNEDCKIRWRVIGAMMMQFFTATIALVGKGVTFDSGGLNIKTGGSMSDMKSDMSGAAAVAATMIALAGLKPKLNVIGAIPLVENMPSGKATRSPLDQKLF